MFSDPGLTVKGLTIYYRQGGGVFSDRGLTVKGLTI